MCVCGTVRLEGLGVLHEGVAHSSASRALTLIEQILHELKVIRQQMLRLPGFGFDRSSVICILQERCST